MTQLSRALSYAGCMEIQGYWRGMEQWGVYIPKTPEYYLDSHPIPHYLIIIQWITHSIMPIHWSHLLCVRFCGSSQPGSIISSYPFSTLREPEPLIITHSFWMIGEVQRSVDDPVAAFWLRCFTQPVGVIHLARSVHSYNAKMLGYVHFWLWNRCPTPAPHPPVLPPVHWTLVGVCVGPQILVPGVDFSLMRTHTQVLFGLQIAIVTL